jgi:hypothetical protein
MQRVRPIGSSYEYHKDAGYLGWCIPRAQAAMGRAGKAQAMVNAVGGRRSGRRVREGPGAVSRRNIRSPEIQGNKSCPVDLHQAVEKGTGLEKEGEILSRQ